MSGEPVHIFSRIWRALSRRIRVSRAALKARRDTEARVASLPLQRLLILCYGNIYRSPFLAEYVRARTAGRLEIRSAGFHPKVDRSSPPRHVAMSAAHGVALEQHRSSLVTREDLDWADAIVIMDRHNLDHLHERGVDERKVLWAGCLCGGDPEIQDPYELDEQGAQAVIKRLMRCGDRLIEETSRRSSRPEGGQAVARAPSSSL